MRKIIIPIFSLLLISCGDEQKENKKTFYVCDCNQMQQVRNDIKQSLSPSNNKSDEEMEDVIKQLQKTFIQTTCPKMVLSYSEYEVPVKTDSCKFYFEYNLY